MVRPEPRTRQVFYRDEEVSVHHEEMEAEALARHEGKDERNHRDQKAFRDREKANRRGWGQIRSGPFRWNQSPKDVQSRSTSSQRQLAKKNATYQSVLAILEITSTLLVRQAGGARVLERVGSIEVDLVEWRVTNIEARDSVVKCAFGDAWKVDDVLKDVLAPRGTSKTARREKNASCSM